MATNELILRKVQAGLETTPGTGVAATRVVYAQTQLSYNQPVQEFVDQSGTRFADRRFAQGRATVGLSATDMVTFEDLPWWMQLGIKGGVAATNPTTPGTGSGSATVGYGYYFKPSASVFDLKTATLEVGEPGNVYKTTQAAVNSFTLRFDPDSNSEPAWMIDLELISRDLASSTYTGALSDRTTYPATAAGTKVYMDAVGGTLGTTQLVGRLISGSITYANGLHYKAFSEDALYAAANKIGFDRVKVTGQLVLEFNTDTEFAKFRTGVGTMVRLEREGPDIAGTTGPVKRKITVDMPLCYYTDIDVNGNRDGNMTCTVSFTGYYDATLGAPFAVHIVNGLATLP